MISFILSRFPFGDLQGYLRQGKSLGAVGQIGQVFQGLPNEITGRFQRPVDGRAPANSPNQFLERRFIQAFAAEDRLPGRDRKDDPLDK